MKILKIQMVIIFTFSTSPSIANQMLLNANAICLLADVKSEGRSGRNYFIIFLKVNFRLADGWL